MVSGFRGRAQWFRNVEVNPAVRVYVASRKPAPAVANRLDHRAAVASLKRYAAAHPGAWANLRPVVEATLGMRIDEQGTDLPMITIDLSDRQT